MLQRAQYGPLDALDTGYLAAEPYAVVEDVSDPETEHLAHPEPKARHEPDGQRPLAAELVSDVLHLLTGRKERLIHGPARQRGQLGTAEGVPADIPVVHSSREDRLQGGVYA
ncbi:hypothetical protein [Streptomyces sp. KMM 9044]|uniref:hypothetical protein n=1 Tax=Streptomyces sp. KMM 9044 TaxID=2744474 RepID=UPI0021513D7A|nr:hypothetical protein [Streptomyces sp. KMM 9044]WAX78038.1 hypothetical protein HUV60_010520 [Streptomyces sp. KMM 9044]